MQKSQWWPVWLEARASQENSKRCLSLLPLLASQPEPTFTLRPPNMYPTNCFLLHQHSSILISYRSPRPCLQFFVVPFAHMLAVSVLGFGPHLAKQISELGHCCPRRKKYCWKKSRNLEVRPTLYYNSNRTFTSHADLDFSSPEPIFFPCEVEKLPLILLTCWG